MFNSGIAMVRRMVRWNAPVILLCFLLSSAASAAADPSPAPTPGPKNPPIVEGKPVKVKVGIFVTNLIEFFPLLAMVAIAYSAFWIRITDYYTQISITLTAILTEIAFLFAISTSLPKVPYLTFIDAFFLISFVFSCSSMIELIAVHQALERDFQARGERMRRLSKYFGPLVYFGLIGLSALVFFVG